MATNIQRLVPIFGSSKEIARVAGIDKSAVVRWRQGKHPVKLVYKERIFAAAQERGYDLAKVGRALGFKPCPNCGTYHAPGG
jgi:hypothetical protein